MKIGYTTVTRVSNALRIVHLLRFYEILADLERKLGSTPYLGVLVPAQAYE